MKAWQIIGWTYHGACYCPKHKPEPTSKADAEEDLFPIFASDEAATEDYCDVCFEMLME